MNKPRYQDLLYQVGSGLHSWSLVEMELAHLFTRIAQVRDADPHVVFGAVINFETRMAICDKLVQGAPYEPIEKAIWTKLSARLSKFYKKRHELAHFTLGRDGDQEVIYPFLTTATLREANKPKLTATQIEERIDKFMELQAALEWFGEIIPFRRMPLQAPFRQLPEEPPLVARLRELAGQNPEEREQRGSSPQG